MAEVSTLLAVFDDYALKMTRDYDVGEVLYRLTDQAVDVLALDAAGVSLADGNGALKFVSATDDRVIRIEERQISLGQGPCHDAFDLGETMASADLTEEPRWPAFADEALQQGCKAVAGIPMVANGSRIGAMNIFSNQPRAWSAEDLQIAQILAHMASGYIKNVRMLSASQLMTAQLQHALDSRIIIEQAKGILAERNGTTPHKAFETLRQHARSNNLRIHDLCHAVVKGQVHL